MRCAYCGRVDEVAQPCAMCRVPQALPTPVIPATFGIARVAPDERLLARCWKDSEILRGSILRCACSACAKSITGEIAHAPKSPAAERLDSLYDYGSKGRCQCDDPKHGGGCVGSAFADVVRNGRRLSVCDRCELTGDARVATAEGAQAPLGGADHANSAFVHDAASGERDHLKAAVGFEAWLPSGPTETLLAFCEHGHVTRRFRDVTAKDPGPLCDDACRATRAAHGAELVAREGCSALVPGTRCAREACRVCRPTPSGYIRTPGGALLPGGTPLSLQRDFDHTLSEMAAAGRQLAEMLGATAWDGEPYEIRRFVASPRDDEGNPAEPLISAEEARELLEISESPRCSCTGCLIFTSHASGHCANCRRGACSMHAPVRAEVES